MGAGSAARRHAPIGLDDGLIATHDCTRPAYARAMREVVARRIIDMAQRGIRDQKELADGAVRFLAMNYRYERKSRQGPSGTAVAPSVLPEITGADSGESPLAP